jgi:hypothetical protein
MKPSVVPLAVTFATAAEISSLSKSTLRRMALDGRLQTSKLGRRRVVLYSSLCDLIQARVHTLTPVEKRGFDADGFHHSPVYR